MTTKTLPFRAPAAIAESIADLLRDRVAGGVYPPGSWIRENSLAEEFQVSNGPIREALQTLVNEKLLVREPWRGVRVVSLTDAEIVEVFQIRLALQEIAAELAAQRVTPAQIADARAVLAAMQTVLEQEDIDAQMPLGGKISSWLCACSGNARLEESWSRLTHQTRMYIYESLRRSKNLGVICGLWQELVDAIEQGDIAKAKLAVRKLARRSLNDLGLDLGL